MITINTVSSTKFSFNGITYHKNFMPFVYGNKISIVNAYDACISLTTAPTHFSEYIVNGSTFTSVAALQLGLLDIIYTRDSLSGGGGSGGTVTSVSFEIGNSGTDLNKSVSDPTSNPLITLNIPTASAINRGVLSSTDWSTFNTKEPTIISGTTAQYFRGDKTFATLNKTAVGLANVDNTSDANKPISSATQTALNLKANDDDVVHLTGNETITGNKTFSGFIIGNSSILLKQDGLPDYNVISAVDGGFDFYKNSGQSFTFQIRPDFIKFGNSFNDAIINTLNLTQNRTYSLLDADGTIALTNQLHNAVTLGTSNGLSLSGQQLSLGLASGSANGALSSTDWTTFNNKQNALTNPITGTGTTNFLPKFTGASSLGNSLIFDNGTNVGIGTTSPDIFSRGYDRILGISGSGITKIELNGSTYSGIDLGQAGTRYGEINVSSTSFDLGTINTSPLYFQTNGSYKMAITSGGNVGIGETNPNGLWSGTNRTLQITAGTNTSSELRQSRPGATITRFLSGTSSTFGVYTADALNYEIYTNNTSRLFITSGGNVGIGTTSPTQRLDVNGLINSNNGISVGGSGVSVVWTGTQAAYDAIGTKSSTTIYFIQ